jgi:thioredoxin 1
MVKGTLIMRFSSLVFIVLMFVAQESVLPQKKLAATAVKAAPITFVELGSVNCIPCRQMQPVMKAIEKKFGDQIRVIFYDVWKEDQKQYAQKYGIRLIPTQVFLDTHGKELMRHEGFFPEKDIDAFLQTKGLTPEPSKKDH